VAQQPIPPYLAPIISDIRAFEIADLTFFIDDIDLANVCKARMISPFSEFLSLFHLHHCHDAQLDHKRQS